MADISFKSFSQSVADHDHPTNFGIYDNDVNFQNDATNCVFLVQRNCGSPVLESELSNFNIFSAVEESTLEYSMTINRHHARNILLDMLGQPTGSLSGSENAYVLGNTTEFARKLTIQYAQEIGANSSYPTFTASIQCIPGQQKYDLLSLITGSHPTFNAGNVQIRKVYHYEPQYRFFNSSNLINFLGNNFGGTFAASSPETIFYMLPLWEDVLRQTQIEFNQRVRRSNTSFTIEGFKIKLFPIPTRDIKVFFDYTTVKDGGVSLSGSTGVTSNISNIAFGHLNYSSINSMGKVWIWNMTVAKCKIMLANIRGKYNTLPVPNGEVTLNWAQLEAQGQREMENLRQELKETLDLMSYKNLMTEKQELMDLAVKEWGRLPKFVYRSR